MTFDEWYENVFDNIVETEKEKEFHKKMEIIFLSAWKTAHQEAARKMIPVMEQMYKYVLSRNRKFNRGDHDMQFFCSVSIQEFKQKYLEGK